MPLRDRKPRKIISHRIAVGRLGAWNEGSKKRAHPSRLDYFEITEANMDKDKNFPVDKAAHEALKAFGERDTDHPTRVPIRVDSDNIDDFLTQDYETWVKREQRMSLFCRGDGVQAERFFADGTSRKIPCHAKPEVMGGKPERLPKDLLPILNGRTPDNPDAGFRCPFAQNKDSKTGPCCKPTTEMVVRLEVVRNIGSRARYRSHGHGTADALRSSLDDIKATIPGGILEHIPLNLVVDRVFGDYGGQRTWQPRVRAELRVNFDKAIELLDAQLRIRTQLEGSIQERKKLLAAAREELATPEEIEGEFVVDAYETPSASFGKE